VVVSKKIAASAVKRNRIRRRLFEQIRTQGRLSNLPIDMVLYVKTAELATVKPTELAVEVAEITKKVLARLK
jgi:ribonuclease P protein component